VRPSLHLLFGARAIAPSSGPAIGCVARANHHGSPPRRRGMMHVVSPTHWPLPESLPHAPGACVRTRCCPPRSCSSRPAWDGPLWNRRPLTWRRATQTAGRRRRWSLCFPLEATPRPRWRSLLVRFAMGVAAVTACERYHPLNHFLFVSGIRILPRSMLHAHAAGERGMADRMAAISLGQGQGAKAAALIAAAVESGSWVVLQVLGLAHPRRRGSSQCFCRHWGVLWMSSKQRSCAAPALHRNYCIIMALPPTPLPSLSAPVSELPLGAQLDAGAGPHL
jgi:hypothetical protein